MGVAGLATSFEASSFSNGDRVRVVRGRSDDELFDGSSLLGDLHGELNCTGRIAAPPPLGVERQSG